LTAAKGRYNNTVTFTYDVAGRPATETLTAGGANYEVEYGYDYGNRLVELTYPDDTVVDRGYTDRGELDDIDYESAAVADRLFDDGGRLTQTTYGNSLVESRGYSRDDDMVTSIGITGVTGFGYSYDANKNRTAQTDSVQTNHAWTAAYDNEDRLTSFDKSTYNQHDQTWTLSNEGDWDSTTLGGTPETRTHDDVHQLTQRGATNQAFDAKGNHLGPVAANPRYTWDQDNYLASADTNQDGAQDVEYEYDALGRRVKKTVGDDVTLYVSRPHPVQGRQRGQVLAEYEYTLEANESPVGVGATASTTPQLARKFVYGDYIDEPLMLVAVTWEEQLIDPKDEKLGTELTATETKYYYHHNANYNVAAMTDSTQTIKEQYRYSAYGQITTITTNNIGNPCNFTSRRYDPETGLYYNYGCHYDPIQGRRLNRDRLEYVDSLNTYQWLISSPLQKLDPSGLACCGPDITNWLASELLLYFNYAKAVNKAIDNKWADEDSAWYEPDFVRAKAYRYAFVLIIGPQLKYAPDTTFSSNSCPTLPKCKNTVTLAGECIDRSEVGNFVYGAVARYFLMTWTQTWAGAIVGNRGKRTNADAAAVSLGYDYGSAGGNLAAFLKGRPGKLKTMGSDAPDGCGPCTEAVANIPAYHVKLPKVDKHNAKITLPKIVADK
jgi:RHS repeat-associated protein